MPAVVRRHSGRRPPAGSPGTRPTRARAGWPAPALPGAPQRPWPGRPRWRARGRGRRRQGRRRRRRRRRSRDRSPRMPADTAQVALLAARRRDRPVHRRPTWAAARSALLDVDHIEVVGGALVTPVEAAAGAGLRRGQPLVAVDAAGAGRRLAACRGSTRRSVERAFPNTVRIHLTERVAAAAAAPPRRRLGPPRPRRPRPGRAARAPPATSRR